MLQFPAFSEIPCETAEEFVSYVRSSHPLWEGPSRKWGFRGQADTSWRLVPKAFRDGFRDQLYREYAVPATDPGIEQARLEIETFLEFFGLADAAGLRVPGAEFIHGVGFEQRLEHFQPSEWPFHEVLAGLAIAQHHGIPTRLLDFTSTPTVAAFFSAIPRLVPGRTPFLEDRICIWAVNLLFANYSWGVPAYLNRSIETVRAPTADNLFLNRQRGFFLFHLRYPEFPKPPIDELVTRRFMDPRHRNSIEQSGIDLQHFAPPLVYRITTPSALSREILEILDRQDGMSRATLMPNSDNVTATLEFWRDNNFAYE